MKKVEKDFELIRAIFECRWERMNCFIYKIRLFCK